MDSNNYFSPPPAYSEQEFDRKISHATNLSIHTAQLERRADEDGWEPYDPEAFEGEATRTPTSKVAPAKVGSLTSWHPGASSAPVHQSVPATQNQCTDRPTNTPSVLPLRIEKKSQPAFNSPSTQAPGYSTDDRTSLPSSSGYHKQVSAYTEQGSVNFSSFSTPPSFANQVNARISAAIPNIDINPERNAEDYRHSLVDPYYTHVTSPRQSLPPPMRPHITLPERPMSYSPSSASPSPSVPRIDFNPYVAYGNGAPTSLPVQPPPRRLVPDTPFDPNAFYNAAVSAQLKPSRPSQAYPSYFPSSNQPQHQAQHSNYPQSGAQQQPLNSPLRSVRPATHAVNDIPRQTTWQPTTRPTTSYGASDAYPVNSTVSENNRYPQYSSNRYSVYSNHSNR